MPIDAKLLQFLQNIHNRSFVDQVNWQRGDDLFDEGTVIGQEYVVRFYDCVLSVTLVRPSSRPEYVVIEIRDLKGRVLRTARAEANAAEWSLFHGLYESATQSSSLWSHLVDEADRMLETFGRIGVPPRQDGIAAPEAFFRRVAGKWHLQYREAGQEDLRIDESGNYFLLLPDKEVRYFTLENVLFDPSTNHVSFDKIDTGEFDPKNRPQGHHHARDVLDISSDWRAMQGYGEPERYPLKYTRIAL